MGNGKLKSFNNINENEKELLKKINSELKTLMKKFLIICINILKIL